MLPLLSCSGKSNEFISFPNVKTGNSCGLDLDLCILVFSSYCFIILNSICCFMCVCMYYTNSSLLKVVRQDHYSVEGYKFKMLKTEISQNHFKLHSYDAVW